MQKFLLIRIITLFIVAFLFNSCVKTEVKNDLFTNPQIEAFLKIPANSGEELKIVTTELRQQLISHNFINDFIQWHGKPMWDKAIFIKNKNNSKLFNGLIPVKSILTDEITAYITCNNLEGKLILKAFNKTYLTDRFEETKRDSIKTLRQLMIFPYLENKINGRNFIDLKNGRLTLSAKNVGQTENIASNSVHITWVCITYVCAICNGNDPDCPYGGTWQECTPIYSEEGGEEPCTWCPPPPGGGGGCTSCEPPPGECESSKTTWYSIIPPLPCEGVPNSSTVAYLANTLGLSSARINWLNNNPNDALTIKQSLDENKIVINNDDVMTIFIDPGALIASKITIDAGMNDFLYGPFNTAHYNSIKGFIPNSQNYTNFDPIFWAHFSIQCALIKIEHPEWGALKIYWEATNEVIHLGLDLIGLVPVIGEIADLANGIIYSIQGDGINATLSFAAMIPVGGWAATGAKFAKKTITAIGGSTRTLKWMKQTNNIINFGDRGLLRKVLGLASGDSRIAHHIIPWEKATHPAIQKAASGNNAFHLNELLNGIPLNQAVHSGNHAVYLARVQTRLDAIPTGLSPNATRDAIVNIINDIKTAIQNSPNTHIDNLIF